MLSRKTRGVAFVALVAGAVVVLGFVWPDSSPRRAVTARYLIAGHEPRPMGNSNFTAAPSGTFNTREGLLNIAANKQEQFEALAEAIGRPELIRDSRFGEREARKDNRAVLTVEIETAPMARPAT